MPGTRDVGRNIRELRRKGGRSEAQIKAIALDQARRAGAGIPDKRKGRSRGPFRGVRKRR